MNIRRGDVFNINFGSRRGHGQEGLRPAIVVQSDIYCELSTLWVIPTSTRAKSNVDFHIPVTILGRRTYALIEQLTTVDKQRRIKPDNYLCHFSEDEMEAIDEMMRIFGGLDPTYGIRF